jgi:DNA-binding transcriptional LysR family regulator
MMHNMNWDDYRFVWAVVRHGSLLRAARALGVDHTTVGRRVEAAEQSLGVKLFRRSTAGVVLTADGERLVESLQRVEDAVLGLERAAQADAAEAVGRVRVTSPESFGIAWLAPALGGLAEAWPGLVVELEPGGAIADLHRGEAEIALRFFRTTDAALTTRRVAEVGHGVYASRGFLARHPVAGPEDLAGCAVLGGGDEDAETQWLLGLAPGMRVVFRSPLALVLAGAARAGVGVTVLPRFVGDADAELVYVPMPNEPRDTLWLTLHRDLRGTPRVRAVVEWLLAKFEAGREALRGGR